MGEEERVKYVITPTILLVLILSGFSVIVSNVVGGGPPSLVLFDPTVEYLFTVTVNGVTLPGTTGTSITYIHWDWGDGGGDNQWFPATHIYPDFGDYTVTVTSYQSDGQSTTKTTTVTLIPPDPPVPTSGKDTVWNIAKMVNRYHTDPERQTLLTQDVEPPISVQQRIGIYNGVSGSYEAPDEDVIYLLPTEIRSLELEKILDEYGYPQTTENLALIDNMGTPEDILQYFSSIWGTKSRNEKNALRHQWLDYWDDYFSNYANDMWNLLGNIVPETGYNLDLHTPLIIKIWHKLTIVVSPMGSGTIFPSEGAHWYSKDSSVAVSIESVTEGYVFDHWELGGNNMGDADPFTIILDSPYTLTAVFEAFILDFNIWTVPSSVNIERDSSDTTTVYISSVNDFSEDVSLSVTNLPTGISPSFSKNPVHPPPSGQDSSTITFSVDINVPCGTYYPSVVGTSSSKTHDFLIELEITGVEVTWEIINEIDGRITPGDRVEYSISVHNHMQIPIDNVKVTITSYSPTPIGIEVDYASQYIDLHTQDYESIVAIDTKAKSWQLQVWKTLNAPFYPGQDMPRSNILDEVPIGGFEVTIDVEWTDEHGSHQITEELPITIQYPDFGPPPTGYGHYIGSSSYYHVNDLNVKSASAKAICGTDDYAADSPLIAATLLRLWVLHYWVKPHDIELLYQRWWGRVSDTTTLISMKNDEKCGFCLQCSEVTVSLIRSLNIPARVVVGYLQWWGKIPRGHQWLEAYFDNNWVHIDPSLGEVPVDSSEPFEGYINHKDFTGVTKAAACKVTDCPHYSARAKPWDSCPNYSSNWEVVTSKYNPYTDTATGTVILIQEEGHFLSMDIYDSEGRHVKIDFETNSTLMDIPDSCYIIDWNYSVIFLPANITDFDVIVDARYAEQPVETYNLTSIVIVNSTVTSQANYQSTINASDTEGYHAHISNQTMDFTPGIHSVTILDVMPLKTIIGKGYNLPVDLCLGNQGDFSESLNITIYANTTIIAMLTNMTVASENTTTIICNLNTTSLTYGNYTITVFVMPSVGEVNITDNTAYCIKEICITIAGDVDADFDVDLYDAVKLLARYGAKEGDPNYDPNCDINCNGKIYLYDAVILLSHYGQKDP